MNKRLAALCAAVSLGVLGAASAYAESAPAAAPAPAKLVEPTPMVFPAMGFDPGDLDRTVKPGDDFYRFVNGKWQAATPIPPQYPAYGVGTNLSLGAKRDLRQIVDQMAAVNAAKGSIEQRVGDGYKAFMNVAAMNARGLAPAQPYLAQIAAAKSLGDLATLFGTMGYPAPFGTYVSIDSKNPSANTLYAGMSGLGLPDRDNYLVDTPRNIEMRAKYKDYVAYMLGKAGYADPKASAEAVYNLEKQIAAADWDRAVSRDPRLTYNRVSRTDLVKMAGAFPLQATLDKLGIGDVDSLVVGEMPPTPEEIAELKLSPEQLAKLGGGMPAMFGILRDTPVDTWKAWMASHFLSSAAPNLTTELDNANFAFYGTYLTGRQVQRERWQRALSAVEGQMGEAVGKLYVERHFPAASKAAMVDLVGNLRKAMRASIQEGTWMSPATRAEALTKLDSFGVKIGYPDKFETYDGLAISADDPLGNSIAAEQWQWNKQLRELKEPVDKAKWLMTPQTVNAYYMPPANEIVFPAAYLQAPNFSISADPAVNYGAIGTTIGHEIGHGFDDQGSRYDGTGALRSWWTDADRTAFNALGSRLATQYSKVCPYDDGKTCINGQLTLGENLGDLTGVTIAYRAYHMSLNGKKAPVINGLTGDQRFFIAYAVSHREQWREALERQILQTDPHSPDYARTNEVLRNFDPWYKAFNVKPGDKLWLDPKDRVKVW
ncbi:M13 family metallopeptidase [Novosphingobium tardum]|uniref:M13 family metallopeptidase n=1 Tax=Novosphingobium tardum TaxID=1538021 RepID=A0ABV8RLP8_9SPHN